MVVEQRPLQEQENDRGGDEEPERDVPPAQGSGDCAGGDDPRKRCLQAEEVDHVTSVAAAEAARRPMKRDGVVPNRVEGGREGEREPARDHDRPERGGAERSRSAQDHDKRNHGREHEQLDRQRRRKNSARERSERHRPSARPCREGERSESERDRRGIGCNPDRLGRVGRRTRKHACRRQAPAGSGERASDGVGRDDADEGEYEHARPCPGHRAPRGRRLRLQQQVEAGRLRREHLGAELLAVTKRIDAREVHALVVARRIV